MTKDEIILSLLQIARWHIEDLRSRKEYKESDLVRDILLKLGFRVSITKKEVTIV